MRLIPTTRSGAPAKRAVIAGAPHGDTLLDTLGLVLAQLREAEADRDMFERISLAAVEAVTALRGELDVARSGLALTTETTQDAIRTTRDAIRFAEEASEQAAAARNERYFAVCAGCSEPIGDPQTNTTTED